MVRFGILAVSLLLALNTVPAHAEGPGDVLQGIGRAMNGEPPPPYRDPNWRDHQREREQSRLERLHRVVLQQLRARARDHDRIDHERHGMAGEKVGVAPEFPGPDLQALSRTTVARAKKNAVRLRIIASAPRPESSAPF